MPKRQFRSYANHNGTQSCGLFGCSLCDYKGNARAINLHVKYSHTLPNNLPNTDKTNEMKCPLCSFVSTKWSDFVKHKTTTHRVKNKM